MKAKRDATLRGYGDLIRDGKAAGTPWRQAGNGLTEEQVEHLDKLAADTAEHAIKGPPGDYGPKFSEVKNRIYSTGPDRIVNQEQLDAMAARREINPAGHAAATKELKEMNEAGAEGEREMRKKFWDVAERVVQNKVTPTSTVPVARQMTWAKAMPVITAAFQQGREKGLTTAQLTDPTSKDSIWPIVEQFKPPKKEAVRAQILDDDERAPGAKPAAAPVDWQKITTEDEAVQAWENHQINEAQARALYEKFGWGGKSATPEVPAGGVSP